MVLKLPAGDLSRLFAANIWVNFIFFLTFVVLGLILSNVEFGAFRVAQAYVAIATSIAMLGLNTAVTHQFPRFSEEERRTALPVILAVAGVSSCVAGVALYFLVPTTSTPAGLLKQGLYAASYPLLVIGAVTCNIVLAFFQAKGELARYSRFQAVWKSLVFLSAIGGGMFFDARSVLIAMGLVYPAFFLIYGVRPRLSALFPYPARLRALAKRIFKSAIWPFASACVSIIYANIEFLNIDEGDLDSGLAGAYSLASLIFTGGTAFFLPFQTYAGSRVANGLISLRKLFRLQALCLAAVIVMATAAYGAAHALNYLHPLKFTPDFLDFAFLVCVKLSIWGSFAVIGSVLNFVDKGFASFMLTLIVLSSILIAFAVFDITTLREVVIIQILSSVFVLLGCAYLVVAGYRGR